MTNCERVRRALLCKSSVVKVGAGKRVTAIQANRQHPTSIVSAGPIQRDFSIMSTERVRVKVCIGDWCPHLSDYRLTRS